VSWSRRADAKLVARDDSQHTAIRPRSRRGGRPIENGGAGSATPSRIRRSRGARASRPGSAGLRTGCVIAAGKSGGLTPAPTWKDPEAIAPRTDSTMGASRSDATSEASDSGVVHAAIDGTVDEPSSRIAGAAEPRPPAVGGLEKHPEEAQSSQPWEGSGQKAAMPRSGLMPESTATAAPLLGSSAGEPLMPSLASQST
jgi:hypothetical protein